MEFGLFKDPDFFVLPLLVVEWICSLLMRLY